MLTNADLFLHSLITGGDVHFLQELKGRSVLQPGLPHACVQAHCILGDSCGRPLCIRASLEEVLFSLFDVLFFCSVRFLEQLLEGLHIIPECNFGHFRFFLEQFHSLLVVSQGFLEGFRVFRRPVFVQREGSVVIHGSAFTFQALLVHAPFGIPPLVSLFPRPSTSVFRSRVSSSDPSVSPSPFLSPLPSLLLPFSGVQTRAALPATCVEVA